MKNNTQKLPKSVSSFMAKIGRLGGRASSPAKTKANRLNAKKRWMNQPKKKKKITMKSATSAALVRCAD